MSITEVTAMHERNSVEAVTDRALADGVERALNSGAVSTAVALRTLRDTLRQIAVDKQTLEDIRVLRDYAARCASKALGAQLSLAVSGNGEAWRVFMDDAPITALSRETPFEGALREAAKWVLQNGLTAPAAPSPEPSHEAVGQAAGVVPRATVRWFAEQMELKLRENDHKGGWHGNAWFNLLNRIGEELRELRRAARKIGELGRTPERLAKAIREAADVANMAHMVADHFRQGGPSEDQGQTLAAPQPKPDYSGLGGPGQYLDNQPPKGT